VTTSQSASLEELKSSLGCLTTLAILAWILWILLPASWTAPLLYSVIYETQTSKVHYVEKPKDCEFMHAPLGDKSCHYKKVVYAYNLEGELIGGDDAPKFSEDKNTNKPIVSFDNGKTWTFWLEGKGPDRRVERVDVDWTRVSE
jgi:hypothetical protein